mmetsp:Transcript_36839/g.60664  ORF Transcript_36839/g.60664 Transcript_36839/m.60664 type:complete len:329 (+) Transcript_36839:94-1080(+)
MRTRRTRRRPMTSSRRSMMIAASVMVRSVSMRATHAMSRPGARTTPTSRSRSRQTALAIGIVSTTTATTRMRSWGHRPMTTTAAATAMITITRTHAILVVTITRTVTSSIVVAAHWTIVFRHTHRFAVQRLVVQMLESVHKISLGGKLNNTFAFAALNHHVAITHAFASFARPVFEVLPRCRRRNTRNRNTKITACRTHSCGSPMRAVFFITSSTTAATSRSSIASISTISSVTSVSISITTSAATVTTTTTTTTKRLWSAAIRTRSASGLHDPSASMTLVIVQCVDRIVHLFLLFHFHERKLFLDHHVHHRTMLTKRVFQIRITRSR